MKQTAQQNHDKPREECGVFGIYCNGQTQDVASLCYYGLYALQHRGQESCGIAVNNNGQITNRRDLGLVNEVFNKENLQALGKGQMGLGQVRYAADSLRRRSAAQPLVINHTKGSMTLAHNGSITNRKELQIQQELKGGIFQCGSDAEIIAYSIIAQRLSSDSIEQAIEEAMYHLQVGNAVLWLKPSYDDAIKPNLASFRSQLCRLHALISSGKALSVWAVGAGGPAEGIFKMCLGNQLGFSGNESLSHSALFSPAYGSFLVEVAPEEKANAEEVIGKTTSAYSFAALGETLPLAPLQQQWQAKLEPVFPSLSPSSAAPVPALSFQHTAPLLRPRQTFSSPSVFLPVFPGTNCEYDTAKAIRKAGARPLLQVIRNLTPQDIAASVATTVQLIRQSQAIVLPGGFSGGDEPEGSAKLIAAYFRNPAIAEAVADLLENRDGLMLGICNGFQALIKLGLLPFGKIMPQTAESPTLTFNTIGRHQSGMVHTKITSNLSPWLANQPLGTIHTIPISHGEGRFIAPPQILQQLIAGGQVAAQYVTEAGTPSMDIRYNPNGSTFAVEAITSPDRRILGKMGHSERVGNSLYKNIPGNTFQNLFENAVSYFSL